MTAEGEQNAEMAIYCSSTAPTFGELHEVVVVFSKRGEGGAVGVQQAVLVGGRPSPAHPGGVPGIPVGGRRGQRSGGVPGIPVVGGRGDIGQEY